MSTIRNSLILSALAVSTVAAQPLEARRAAGGIPAAKLLLANSAELGLNDQQVLRLAAITRRAVARQASLRASIDSARVRLAPGSGTSQDTMVRRQTRERMRSEMQRFREQARVDLRDAIAVLTPDQQARAWEMAARRAPNRGMRAPRGFRERGMRRAPRDRSLRAPRPPRPSGRADANSADPTIRGG